MKTETDIILAIKKIFNCKLSNNVLSIKTDKEVTESISNEINDIRYHILKMGAFESRHGGFFFNTGTSNVIKVSLFIREYESHNRVCKHMIDIKISS